MCVHEVGVRSRPRSGATERHERERQQAAAPRLAAQVADDTVAVGDSEVAKIRRGDDFDLDLPLAEPVDRIGDEAPRGVARVTRIRTS